MSKKVQMSPSDTTSRGAAKRRLTADQTLELWRSYKESGDPALRDRLVLTFAPLVKYIVYKKAREIPARCEIEDFISCGLEALIRSIERYDPEKGATLEQFAWTRIHGAVLDELRRQDWAPRSVRRWARQIQGARDHFTSLHGRPPTTEELADMLGVEVEELRRHQEASATGDVLSLNALVQGDEQTTIERIDTLESTERDADPEDATAREMAKERFRRAFAVLPEREREIAVLLYVKNLTLREIGEILGVSESRVCQIHGETRKKLRRLLADDALLFSAVA
jgi:RNA polymerase sigma factor for flagellar operon FliA